MERFWGELRHASRRLAGEGSFTAAVVATLALGIGANTAIFSGIRAVVLRPLPLPEPDRLVAAYQVWPTGVRAPWSYPKAQWLQRESRTTEWAGVGTIPLTLGGDPPSTLTVEAVTSNYFRTFGVEPLLGRTFTSAETRTPRGDPFLVLGHALWRSRYAGDPAIVGRTVSLNDMPFTVLGVMPPGFAGHTRAECWIPITMYAIGIRDAGAAARVLQGVHWQWLSLVGRLRPGASLRAAQAETGALHAAMGRTWPFPPGEDPQSTPLVLELREAYLDPELVRALALLRGAVALVLLIACVNVTSLLLARAAGRERDLAVRQALGAGRVALVRASMIESLLLALLGGGTALALGAATTRALGRLQPASVAGPRVLDLDTARVDPVVLGFAAALSLLSAVVFGAWPAFQASRVDIDSALRRGGPASGTGLMRLRPWQGRGLAVVVQLALATALAVNGVLLIRSFASVLAAFSGFRPEGVLALKLSPADSVDAAVTAARFERIRLRARETTGVREASLVSCLPASSACLSTDMRRGEGRPGYAVGLHVAAPGSFRVLGIPLLRGRGFRADDRADAPAVAIVSERAARALGGEVLGQRIILPAWGGSRQIVGVVGDVKYLGLDGPVREEVYVPHLQSRSAPTYLVASSSGDPAGLGPALLRAISDLEPRVTVDDVRTLESRLEDSISQRRFTTVLLAAFAAVALVLAGLGTYSVVSHVAAQGTHEIGVRMALGATPGVVLRAIVAQGLLLATGGLALGALAGLWLTRFVQAHLFAVSRLDPASFAAAFLAALGVATLATYLPARHAAALDPMATLRRE